MSVNVAINGFGRIGRMVFRNLHSRTDAYVVAINANYPVETLVHLIKYDTLHGRFPGEVAVVNDYTLSVDGHHVQIVNQRDPNQLPWDVLKVDIVIEATGKFKTRETAGYHLEAGAAKVIITAPGKDEDATIVMGANEDIYVPDRHHIISNASCTTNCLAPVAKILDEQFGIEAGMMTTVHSYTNDQNNIDNPHKDLRRARACGQSIIPTTTGAAKAVAKVLPQLDGKLSGMALRVPTPNVSLVDLVVDLNTETTVEQINECFRTAANGRYQGIVDYSDEPLVSSDYQTNAFSAVIDGLSTTVMAGNKVKIIAWYDNEWGYSCRIVDLIMLLSARLATGNNTQVS
ncbi:glyceraldehyde-3-phosphate dehydrogenase [Tuberibacillus sp. Marseille-P3662]|uniref:glyceraldehyde-3-phosphate dehydrogenase n=1 Tax=Tuberibacillus sp. Marseille-P3662 TaxID=1965358 RepID=UPI000A1C7D7E|nr:glyceraldehyde-3-phosphate dehydrogenase [Tuberibacillus sp. Marseille-P3662]